jgi:hypothetical protein
MKRLICILIAALLTSLANASIMTLQACPEPSAAMVHAADQGCDESAHSPSTDAPPAHHSTSSHACCPVLGLPGTQCTWKPNAGAHLLVARFHPVSDLGVHDVIFKPPKERN